MQAINAGFGIDKFQIASEPAVGVAVEIQIRAGIWLYGPRIYMVPVPAIRLHQRAHSAV